MYEKVSKSGTQRGCLRRYDVEELTVVGPTKFIFTYRNRIGISYFVRL